MVSPEVIIPVLGIMTGIIVPLGVFVWLYLEITSAVNDFEKKE